MTKADLFTELRAAREARGMSLDDIAQSTLTNIDFLKAIEAGEIVSPCPSPAAHRTSPTWAGLGNWRDWSGPVCWSR